MTTHTVSLDWPTLERLDQRVSILSNQLSASILSAQDLVAELSELRAQILAVYSQNNFGLDQVQADTTPKEIPNANSAVETDPGAASPLAPGPEATPGEGPKEPAGKQRTRRSRPPQG